MNNRDYQGYNLVKHCDLVVNDKDFDNLSLLLTAPTLVIKLTPEG